MQQLIQWLDRHPRATVCFGRATYNDQPAWICMLRTAEAGETFEAIEYRPTVMEAIAAALKRFT